MPPARQIVRTLRAADRLAAARAWLEAAAPGAELLLLAPSWTAADDLVRPIALNRGALFAIHRLTPNRLLGLISAEPLAKAGLAPASGLTAIAVAARAVHTLRNQGTLSYFQPISERPGFATAVARTIEELRLNNVAPEKLLKLDLIGEPLSALFEQFEQELKGAGLADRAMMLAMATAAIKRGVAPRWVGMPLLMLDLRIESVAESEFLAAIAAEAPSVLATVPSGDGRGLSFVERIVGVKAERDEPRPDDESASSLTRLQYYLFGESTPKERKLDETVSILSAPGEARECVEVARRIQSEARRGVPFDRIAVFLHAPAQYAAHLEEALERAGIPAYFAIGTARPEPGGRALLTLLKCAADNLSARRFAEYLSLAQVPDELKADSTGEAFVAPDVDTSPLAVATDFASPPVPAETQPLSADPLPVVEGTVRAPWRWERLMVDAAVIGSRDRWERRLRGLEAELSARRRELEEDDPQAAAIDRALLDLSHLRQVAIPIISCLAELPKGPEWTWGEWLSRLRKLIAISIRDREPVLATLGELEPMAPVGPVGLDEVRAVLSERLGELRVRPPRRRYGAVYVAPAALARGLEFDVVITPALAERLFPQKLVEDPLLPDGARNYLNRGFGFNLKLQENRAEEERLALRLAVGAASARLMGSFPRIDAGQGRPRVPSFYALEVLRAAEGRLPGFDELGQRAAEVRDLRLGWPAPKNPEEAIDQAEFDLALLDHLVEADPQDSIGTANYLLSTNQNLARTLRARARRWKPRWSQADGLVEPDQLARAALERHQMGARSFSPTALQHFAACPYRFYLYTILNLEPREEAEAIEMIDPLTRGDLVHKVQFELLTALRKRGLLPVTKGNLESALELVDGIVERIAKRYHDDLYPAIERVWEEGIDSIRADLREWLTRAAEDGGGWTPDRFELSFGLKGREQADPASQAEPATIEGGVKLRGSIDLVERSPRGTLRATDHKTGRSDKAPKGLVVHGGKILQPLLYAMASEKILNQPVEAGRLYYCTAAGGYEERVVPLNAETRAKAATVLGTIGAFLSEGFMPAAPGEQECKWCNYRMVCGPYEEMRTALKLPQRIEPLARMRKLP